MNKFKYSWITKTITFLLLICCLTGLTVTSVFCVCDLIINNDESFKDDLLYSVSENYACAIISTIGKDEYQKVDPDKIVSDVDSILENTRFACAVLKSSSYDVNDVDLSDESLYIYGSPAIADRYTTSFWGHEYASYNYSLDSFMSAIKSPHYLYFQYDGNDNHDGDYLGDYFYEDEQLTSEKRFYIVLSYFNSEDTTDNLGYWNNVEPYEHDLYSYTNTAYYWFTRCANLSYYLLFVFLFGAVACSIYLVWAAGHRAGSNELAIHFLDKIPLEIYLFVTGFASILIGCIIVFSFEGLNNYHLIFYISVACLLAIWALVCSSFASIIVRAKNKCFLRYTVVYMAFFPIRRLFSYARENLSLFAKVTLLAIGQFLFIYITFAIAGTGGYEYVLFWSVIVACLIAAALYLLFFQLNRLKEGGERIAAGNIDEPIDSSKLIWEFKKHADNLNNIGKGMELAVSDKMKSERFKTELITNVSHDIKTPLTSIINYVDLIKKKEITDPTLVEYIEVLDRQSARLKKLIEDLMEASKASTGNLAVNLEECDVSVMLSQAVGEFEEKMTAKGLIPVVTYPDQPVMISADGRHLWRVFDNLLNNICKYAQPTTRVYINVEQGGDQVSIIFKNISSSQLNISSEELMERFVRGDSSRNTEGSGLGLSIAKSLTELMSGNMELSVDGDLFKVTLSFPSEI